MGDVRVGFSIDPDQDLSEADEAQLVQLAAVLVVRRGDIESARRVLEESSPTQ